MKRRFYVSKYWGSVWTVRDNDMACGYTGLRCFSRTHARICAKALNEKEYEMREVVRKMRKFIKTSKSDRKHDYEKQKRKGKK